ncbi:uncharacterized protein LDX57_006363 [Aspergillus melleus]|uniref:uncharacterized protein n=1 Tax=Aspergillus melleus TaxID=138277 RepID=UPI001E8D8341|nr:uncharacterized protein LDX57_006363 [Aspergillus melleus]KAH8428673.1 hypothetical protein LDX57_006363 [Aspergillus melleus]
MGLSNGGKPSACDYDESIKNGRPAFCFENALFYHDMRNRRVRDIKLSNFHNASTFHNEGFTKGDEFRITIDEKFHMMLPYAFYPEWCCMGWFFLAVAARRLRFRCTTASLVRPGNVALINMSPWTEHQLPWPLGWYGY